MLKLKDVVTALSAVDSKFLRLDALRDALGLAPTDENLWKVLKAVRQMEASASDLFDMGAAWVPMVVNHRGSEASHGITFGKADMPLDPTVERRATSVTPPAKLLIPAVRLVSAEDWNRFTEDERRRDSLKTGVLKTLANLPQDVKALFDGNVKNVQLDPQDGWALVTLRVRVS